MSIFDTMDPDALRRAQERAVARARNGEPSVGSTPRLPPQKSGFPKLLCLDTNFWIGLAQAQNGIEAGARFLPALSPIKAAQSTGTLLVPVLATPLLETGEVYNRGRRERLAAFMVELSDNSSMWGGDVVLRAELRHAIRTRYLDEVPRSFRPNLVEEGMQPASGFSKRMILPDASSQRIHDELLRDREISAHMLAQTFDPVEVSAGRSLDRRSAILVAEIKHNCAGMTGPDRIRAEFWNLLDKGKVAQMIGEIIQEFQIEADAFHAWLKDDDRFVDFFRAVPTQDCFATLIAERDKNGDHQPAPNDMKDFIFLNVALPYANIVATEKSWSHLAQVSGLDRRYDTRITGRPEDIPKLLATEGCIEQHRRDGASPRTRT